MPPTENMKPKYIAWIICVFIFGAATIIASINLANARLDVTMDNNTVEVVKNTLEETTQATCEQGCQYIVENYVGINLDVQGMTMACVEHCAEKEYANRQKFSEIIPKVS